MEKEFEFKSTPATILCCVCGTPIKPNALNMCAECISKNVDITQGIPKQLVIHRCKKCERYLKPPETWVTAEWESLDLMNLCLSRVRGLNKVKLLDSQFLYTEPHSKRIRLMLKVQKEVLNMTLVQQKFQVMFTIQNQMCPDCHKSNTDHTWKALVQVRQQVDHKRTFFYLEQLILKSKLHTKMLDIKESPYGIDFFFATRSHALGFVAFLNSHFPCNTTTSKKLISSDDRNNTYNFKYTFLTTIVPISRYDLIALPPKIANKLGAVNRLLVCEKLSTFLHLVDPETSDRFKLDVTKYNKNAFTAALSIRDAEEYMVVDKEIIEYEIKRTIKSKKGKSNRRKAAEQGKTRRIAELTLSKISGSTNDDMQVVKTHLGDYLEVGDLVLAYDLKNTSKGGETLDSVREAMGRSLPDVVVVKKSYSEYKRYRNWKIKHLEMEELQEKGLKKKKEEDYEQFKEELEEDLEMRSKIQIYRDKTKDAENLEDELDVLEIKDLIDSDTEEPVQGDADEEHAELP